MRELDPHRTVHPLPAPRKRATSIMLVLYVGMTSIALVLISAALGFLR